MNKPPKSQTKNSPPYKGGVPEGRGGSSPNRKKINNLPRLKPFRKDLRNNLTSAEAIFWKAIQNKNFEGRKFRRQHSVGKYILDFYCSAEKLAIELDGEVHFNDGARLHDGIRRSYLQNCGLRVLRFENKLVFEDLEWMLDVIRSNFGWNKTTTPHSSNAAPPLEGGEFLCTKFEGFRKNSPSAKSDGSYENSPPAKEGCPKGGVV
jgi:very-short-patch-repair endonuclease